MIHINFNITNPFSKRWNIVTTKHWLFGNKGIELNFYKTNTIVNISFDIRTRTDHSGFNFMLGLLGIEGEVSFYDIRHWDSRTNNN
jgi:hypothetical protein